jgi:hypothetical protein
MLSSNIVIFSRPYPFALKGIPRLAQDSIPLRLHSRGHVFVNPYRSRDAVTSTPRQAFQPCNGLECGIRCAHLSRRLNDGACDARTAQHRLALCPCAVRLGEGHRTLSVFQRIEGTTQCMPLALFMAQIDDAVITKE